MSRRANGYVYFIYDVGSGLTKIGSTASFERRWSQIKSVNPNTIPLFLINVKGSFGRTPGYLPLESGIHHRFSNKRTYLEWFDLNYHDFEKFLGNKGKDNESEILLNKIRSIMDGSDGRGDRFVCFHKYREIDDIQVYKWVVHLEGDNA